MLLGMLVLLVGLVQAAQKGAGQAMKKQPHPLNWLFTTGRGPKCLPGNVETRRAHDR